MGRSSVEDPVQAVGRLAGRHGLLHARVGLEAPAYYMHPHHYLRLKMALGVALVAEAVDLISDLRMARSDTGIVFIRRAAEIADVAIAGFAAALAAGKTELALAGQVYATLLAHGSGIAASPINLVSGERGAYAHGAPTERALRQGDFGSLEFGATFHRYTTTIGRQFAVGAPTPRRAH